MKKSEGCEGNSFQRYERKKFVKKEIIGGAWLRQTGVVNTATPMHGGEGLSHDLQNVQQTTCPPTYN